MKPKTLKSMKDKIFKTINEPIPANRIMSNEYDMYLIQENERQFKYFKENVIEILKEKYSLEEAVFLYEYSNIEKLLRNCPNYVLHYNMEDWVDWIIKNFKKENKLHEN